jgi:hypothetical protein
MIFGNVPGPLNGWPGQTERIEDAETLDVSLRGPVAAYLAAGIHLSEAVGEGTDHFGSGEPTSLDVMTDGEWVWPGDAAHYVERYGIDPGVDFVDHVLASKGPPLLTEGQLGAALASFDADVARIRRGEAT